MSLAKRLLEVLVPGIPTVKDELASALEVSPLALEQCLAELREYGAPLSCETDQIILRRPLSLLYTDQVTRWLTAKTRSVLKEIDIAWTTGSTNQCVLERWSGADGAHGRVFLAEYQQHGRGRLGRTWVAPIAGSLCLSLGWRLARTAIVHCGTLSTGIGVAVARFLRQLNVQAAQLKWPNDVVVAGHKLGGILIETRPHASGLGLAIGVGINIDLSTLPDRTIDQAYTDLARVAPQLPSRSELAARLLNELVLVLEQFESGDKESLLHEWAQYDSTFGKPVRLLRGVEILEGTAAGIAPDGALLLRTDGKLVAISVGDVSLREG